MKGSYLGLFFNLISIDNYGFNEQSDRKLRSAGKDRTRPVWQCVQGLTQVDEGPLCSKGDERGKIQTYSQVK